MRARKRSKLVSKGEATDSIGEATDLVTGNRGPTVGTAEDPLNYFLGKQLGEVPGFDPDEAWRTPSLGRRCSDADEREYVRRRLRLLHDGSERLLPPRTSSGGSVRQTRGTSTDSSTT